MLVDYVGAGFDPAGFWVLTPRLYFYHMEGAAKRLERDRELAWFVAMLPYLKRTVTLEKFVGRRADRATRVQEFHAAWDKVDRALAASRQGG